MILPPRLRLCPNSEGGGELECFGGREKQEMYLFIKKTVNALSILSHLTVKMKGYDLYK